MAEGLGFRIQGLTWVFLLALFHLQPLVEGIQKVSAFRGEVFGFRLGTAPPSNSLY